MLSTYTPAIKIAVRLASTISAGRLIGQMIAYNVDQPETTREIVQLWIGAAVLGSLVTHHVAAHVEEQFDKTVDFIAECKETATPAE